MKITSRSILTIMFCVYLAAVFILCFINGDGMPKVQLTLLGIPADKLAHFCMFVPYPMLSFLAFRPQEASKRREIMLLCILAALGVGLAYGTEQLQGLTDYRSYELADFYADLTGICFGSLATLILILFRRR